MLFKISDFSLSARNQPIYYAPKQVFESVYTIWDVYLCILAETVKLRRSQIRISNSIMYFFDRSKRTIDYEVFRAGIQKFNSRRINSVSFYMSQKFFVPFQIL